MTLLNHLGDKLEFFFFYRSLTFSFGVYQNTVNNKMQVSCSCRKEGIVYYKRNRIHLVVTIDRLPKTVLLFWVFIFRGQIIRILYQHPCLTVTLSYHCYHKKGHFWHLKCSAFIYLSLFTHLLMEDIIPSFLKPGRLSSVPKCLPLMKTDFTKFLAITFKSVTQRASSLICYSLVSTMHSLLKLCTLEADKWHKDSSGFAVQRRKTVYERVLKTFFFRFQWS